MIETMSYCSLPYTHPLVVVVVELGHFTGGRAFLPRIMCNVFKAPPRATDDAARLLCIVCGCDY